MSILGSIAHAIGHTAESLAHDLGHDVSDLEGLVGDMVGCGIDIFSEAAHLGMDAYSFLNNMTNLMLGDPQGKLLQYVQAPVKNAAPPTNDIATNWSTMADFHQATSDEIHRHISNLFSADGQYSYSGPAAQALWDTHQSYRSYFTTLVDHAYTQQQRHAALGGHYNDFLAQAPGKVHSLPAPLAALGVLTIEHSSVTVPMYVPPPAPPAAPPDTPPGFWDDPEIIAMDDALEAVAAADGAGLLGLPEDAPIEAVGIVILIILAVVWVIVALWVLIKDATSDHNSKQRNTPTPTPGPPPKPPQANLSTEQEKIAQRLFQEYGHLGLSLDDIRDIIAKNPGLTEAQLRQLLDQYARVIAQHPNLVKRYGALAVFEAYIRLAAYDAAKGDPNKNIPVKGDLSTGLEEADALLGVAESNPDRLPWPVRVSDHPGSEAIDANGQEWDVKSPRSGMRPPFDLAKTIRDIAIELHGKTNVVINDSHMSDSDIQALAEAIRQKGWENNVLWWPKQP